MHAGQAAGLCVTDLDLCVATLQQKRADRRAVARAVGRLPHHARSRSRSIPDARASGAATSGRRIGWEPAMNRRLLVILAIVCLAALAVPAGASAQSAGSRFPTVLLRARTARAPCRGCFAARRFRVRGTGLAVFGRLSGTL